MKNTNNKDSEFSLINWNTVLIVITIVIGILYYRNYNKSDIKNESPIIENSNYKSDPCYGNESCISIVRNNFTSTGKTILSEQYLGEGKFSITFVDLQYPDLLNNAVIDTDCECKLTNVKVSTAR
jgi:hypothetical protein